MKVIREVRPPGRKSRGRFWGPKGEDYTADLAQAGLYDHGTLPAWIDHSDELPAVPLLEAEAARLRDRLRLIEELLGLAREGA